MIPINKPSVHSLLDAPSHISNVIPLFFPVCCWYSANFYYGLMSRFFLAANVISLLVIHFQCASITCFFFVFLLLLMFSHLAHASAGRPTDIAEELFRCALNRFASKHELFIRLVQSNYCLIKNIFYTRWRRIFTTLRFSTNFRLLFLFLCEAHFCSEFWSWKFVAIKI